MIDKQILIQMAIVSTVTWGTALIWYIYIRPLHLARKALNWIADGLIRINKRTPWNRLINKGFNIKVGSFEMEIHPRDNRPKLYIQRYGKRD